MVWITLVNKFNFVGSILLSNKELFIVPLGGGRNAPFLKSHRSFNYMQALFVFSILIIILIFFFHEVGC